MTDSLEKHTHEGELWMPDELAAAQAVGRDLYAALAAMQARVEACEAEHPIEPAWAELLAAAKGWAETMDVDRPAYSNQARRLYRAVAALAAGEPQPDPGRGVGSRVHA